MSISRTFQFPLTTQRGGRISVTRKYTGTSGHEGIGYLIGTDALLYHATDVFPTAAVSGIGALAGQAVVVVPASAAPAALGVLAGAAVVDAPTAATIVAAGSLAGIPAAQSMASAAIAASSVVSGTARVESGAAATLAGSGVMSGTPVVVIPVSDAMAAAGALSSFPAVEILESAVVSGDGTLQISQAHVDIAVGPAGLQGSGILSGTAVVLAQAPAKRPGHLVPVTIATLSTPASGRRLAVSPAAHLEIPT